MPHDGYFTGARIDFSGASGTIKIKNGPNRGSAPASSLKLMARMGSGSNARDVVVLALPAQAVGTLLPALGLIVLWGRRIAIRRAGGTTARLHVNLVFFFSLLAAIPTLFVAVFASILFQSGVQFWFSDDSRGILDNANELARGYYDDNLRFVGDNTLAMANDLQFFLQSMAITSPEFAEQYSLQIYSRELSESAILQEAPDGEMRVLVIVDPDEDTERARVTSA